MSVATNLAQQELERLRTLSFTHADLAAGDHDDPDNPINGAYNRRWTVIDDTPVPDMKTLEVSVSFNAGTSADSLSVMRTQITR